MSYNMVYKRTCFTDTLYTIYLYNMINEHVNVLR